VSQRYLRVSILLRALFPVFFLAPIAIAHASTLDITYFTVSSSDPDGGKLCCSTSSDYVLSSLGSNGLPVLNPGGTGGAAVPSDVTSDNELTWWSPALNPYVVETGTSTVTLPFSNTAFYQPNGTGSDDGSGYQAAILSGTLFAPTTEAIEFSIASDDMAFVYLDGTNVCDDGGVHGATGVSCTTGLQITAGSHFLQLFYVDLDPSGAELDFDVTTEGVSTGTEVTPEPGTLMLFGSGLLGLAFLMRRKLVPGTSLS